MDLYGSPMNRSSHISGQSGENLSIFMYIYLSINIPNICVFLLICIKCYKYLRRTKTLCQYLYAKSKRRKTVIYFTRNDEKQIN